MAKEYIDKVSSETLKLLKDIHADTIFKKREKIQLAVTGLNRSGKSIFITSLVNQLVSGKRIQKVSRSRGKEFIAKVIPLEDDSVPEFDYRTVVDALRTEDPKWPKSTSSVSKVRVEIEVKSRSSFFPNKILELEVIDYPGEWLFDLEMYNKEFAEWSESAYSQLRNSVKRELAKEWQSELSKHDIYGFSDGSADRGIVDKYRDYLRTLQNMGFSIIQPGRSVQSGNLSDHSTLLFTPLPPPKYLKPHEDSIYQRFQNRYNRYIKEIVEPLAVEYFSQFDRQIILVDVLKSLQNGYNPFIDMTEAIKKIIRMYEYGEQSFLKKVLEKKIDKVLFGATKADHIASSQHQNYQKLLNTVVEEAERELNLKGIDTEAIVFASVKSTEDIVHDYGGKEMDSLKGRVVGKTVPTIEYSGRVPEDYPPKSEWRGGMFSFPSFSPIEFPDRDIDAVPHINMDEVIDYLIGDKL
jgi:predicted YcjX-like family ATPase